MKMQEYVQTVIGIPWAEWKALTATERVALTLKNDPEYADRETATLPPFARR